MRTHWEGRQTHSLVEGDLSASLKESPAVRECLSDIWQTMLAKKAN